MADTMSVKPIFEAMPLSLNKDAAKEANTVYQVNLSGDGGGQFAVTIKHGDCTVEEGTAATPDVMISAVTTDYLNIVTGAYPFG